MSCDRESESERGRDKGTKFPYVQYFYKQTSSKLPIMENGQKQRHVEAQRKYSENNPMMAKLSQARKEAGVMERRRTDPEYDADCRRKAAEYKQKQRMRQKSGQREHELLAEAEVNIKVEPEDENEYEVNVFNTPRTKRKSGSFENPKPSVLSRIDNTPSPSSRQKEKGEQKRRQNRDEKKMEVDTLNKKVEESGKQIEEKNIQIQMLEAEIEKSKKKQESMKEKMEKGDDWVKPVYENLNSDGKRQFREAFYVASSEIERGTITRLRKTTGLNFSIPPTNNEQIKSETKVKIEAFAEENTIEVPDKKKVSKGIRYRMASKLSLFETFDSQNPNLCTYKTFCKYWPKQYVKPKPSDMGTCMCIICQNAELKTEALKNQIGAEHSLDTVIENARQNDFGAENSFKEALEKLVEDKVKSVVGYSRWEKVKQTELNKNTGRAKSDKVMRQSKTETADNLAESLLVEYEEYKKHLERNSTIKREIKALVIETEENENLAVLHIDWAEQHQLSEVKEVQSAYFAGRFHYEIHTAYIYSKGNNHGAASLSNTADHKAEAVHAAIKSEIVNLKETGKTTVVVVSDSPTSQYRNGKNVFLMKKIAMELGITIRLLFTESGHGKSPCDGVGGNIKTQVEEALLKRHGEKNLKPIHSAEDVKDVIENETHLSYDIKVHTAEEIKYVKDSLPKLGPLNKAMKIHEVLITSDGVTKSKFLPSDMFYENVKIKESRRPRRVETVDYDDDDLEVDEDAEEDDID